LIHTDEGNRQLKKAERLLERGRPDLAIRVLTTVRSRGRRQGGLRYMHPIQFKRAVFLVAVAQMRKRQKPAERAAHIKDSETYFRALSHDRPGVPLIQARLAEALAGIPTPESREEARKILEELADSDLLPDARSYATLALLRATDDKTGANKARRACRRMTRYPRRHCRPTAELSASSWSNPADLYPHRRHVRRWHRDGF
jgi:hypothetical protein